MKYDPGENFNVEDVSEDFLAMKALVDEQDPDITAENLKESGNACFTNGAFTEAIDYYGRAWDCKPKDKVLKSALQSNMSLCYFRLKKYKESFDHARLSIEFNKYNLKCYHRGASALNALGNFSEALIWIEGGLKQFPVNKPLLELKTKLEKNLDRWQKIEALKAKKKKKEEKLVAVLKKRKIKFGPFLSPMFKERKYNFRLSKKKLVFPMWLLYEEHSSADYIECVEEDCYLLSQLLPIFPPRGEMKEWDEKKEYTANNIEVYFEDANGKYHMVPLMTKMIDIITHKDYIVPGVPTLSVFAKNKFSKDFLKVKKAN